MVTRGRASGTLGQAWSGAGLSGGHEESRAALIARSVTRTMRAQFFVAMSWSLLVLEGLVRRGQAMAGARALPAAPRRLRGGWGGSGTAVDRAGTRAGP